MKRENPTIASEGWYVVLHEPAEGFLARRLTGADKALAIAADAQAHVYLMQRAKLRAALTSLEKQRGKATLAKALRAEDALRWSDFDLALPLFGELARRPGELGAWARLREVETLERMGQVEAAEAKLEAAEVILGDQAGLLLAVVTARLRFRRGKPPEAVAVLDAAQPDLSRPSPTLGAYLRALAINLSLSGSTNRAMLQHQRALDCYRALGDRLMLTKQYLSLAQTCVDKGDLDHSEFYCDEALKVVDKFDYPSIEALCASRSGMVALVRGDLPRARDMFTRDLELSSAAAFAPGRAYAQRNLGKVLVRLGDTDAGLALLEQSLKGFGALGDPANTEFSRLEVIAARLPTAPRRELTALQSELDAVSRFFTERNRPAVIALVNGVRARLLLRQGELALAREELDRVTVSLRHHGRFDRLAEVLMAFAALLPDTAKEDSARYLEWAYRVAETAGYTFLAKSALRSLNAINDVAVLELARAPRVGTGPPFALTASAGSSAIPTEIFVSDTRSQAFKIVLEEARQIAETDYPVLISGETGTGKDKLAREVHRRSERSRQLYLPFNCGAVTESLVEAEFFGHEQGAFTGAELSRPGLFESADGGTVFLDEVGELSPRGQVTLLRFLEDGLVRPVGAPQPRHVNVRILAASNRDLPAEVAAGRFRQDLYYRLRVCSLRLPALRDRLEDLPLLVQHFLERIGLARKKGIKSVDRETLEALARHRWPGNLRELDNIIKESVIRCRGPIIRKKHLPADFADQSGVIELFPTLEELERSHIQRALRRAAGHRGRAADMLGIHRNTLAEKIRRYGLE